MRLRVDNPLVALGCGQFALSLMQVMFMFYYVKVYLNVFHVPNVWFNIAQGLFMVWNAINDPLFGYIQDTPGHWLNSRTAVIKCFAPFLACSFVFMWIPWRTEGSTLEGIHLVLSLFLYDAFFSAIGVAWSALFADSTKDTNLRVSAMKYSQISILLSVNIIAITEKLSVSLENFRVFQIVTVVVAVIGLAGLYVAGSLKHKSIQNRMNYRSVDEDRLLAGDESPTKEDPIPSPKMNSWTGALETTKQIVKEPNFFVIIVTNFLHNARSVAHLNFASIATEMIIPQSVLAKGSLQLSAFYGVLTLGPQLLLILNEKCISKHGAAKLMSISYFLSFISGVFFVFSSNAYAVIIFMIIDSVNVHSIAPLFNIIISDFIDDDAARHNRRAGISSVVFSLNALFVKPAQSLAPIVIVYILNSYGYQEYLTTGLVKKNIYTAMTWVLFFTPVLLGSLQYLAFGKYSLRDFHHTAKKVELDV